MLVCGDREAMVMAPSLMHDSAVSPCFHGCLAFLHRHFPPQSLPSQPLNLSLCIQQQPSPWDCSQSLDSSSQPLCLLEDLHPCPGYTCCGKDCLMLIPFGCHRSAISLSALNVSPLTQTIAPMWGLDPCFSSPHLLRGGPVLLTLLFSP